jgi:thioesterase domain-containing protein
MARRLVAEGDDVTFVGLFDVWHPQFREVLSRSDMARVRATQIVVRLQKYGEFVWHGRFDAFWFAVRQFLAKRARRISWRMVRSRYRKANLAVPKAIQTIEAVALHRSYTPMPYPRRIVLFRPNSLYAWALRDRTIGWDQCAMGGVDVHFITGDHGAMVQEPRVT